MLLSIPRSVIDARSFSGELLLGETNTGIRASVGADGALASDSIVVGVAHTLAGVSVAASLIRALNHRVSVIRVLYITDPCGKSLKRGKNI